MNDLKTLLEFHANAKNCSENLLNSPDPLQVARELKDDKAQLICALFAYGNAKLILKFLNKLDFELLKTSEESIAKHTKGLKYRFQNEEDLRQIFITMRRFGLEYSISELVGEGFMVSEKMQDGINLLIKKIYSLNSYKSPGYEFFFGRAFDVMPKSPYKRYNMYLRWMVRDSDIDLGRFTNLPKSALLIPLDVHTHRVCLGLGLCGRKSYDFNTVLDITARLREFDPNDPIKYDFALYRLGQSGEIAEILKNIG